MSGSDPLASGLRPPVPRFASPFGLAHSILNKADSFPVSFNDHERLILSNPFLNKFII